MDRRGRKLILLFMVLICPVPVLGALLPGENLKPYQMTVTLKNSEVTESIGFDYVRSDNGLCFMPSGAGKHKHHVLKYTHTANEHIPQGTRIQVFYPYKDADRPDVQVNLTSIGIMPWITPQPRDQTHFRELVSLPSMATLSENIIESTGRRPRAVVVHVINCTDKLVSEERHLFFDKSGTHLVEDYRNALSAYLIKITLGLISHNNLQLSLAGAAALIMRAPDIWNEMLRSTPLTGLILKGEGDDQWKSLIACLNILKPTAFPDSLKFRQRENTVEVVPFDAKLTAAPLWSATFQREQIVGSEEHVIPDSRSRLTLDDASHCCVEVQDSLGIQSEKAQSQLLRMLTKIPVWNEFTQSSSTATKARLPLENIWRSKIERQSVIDVFRRLNQLHVTAGELLSEPYFTVRLNHHCKTLGEQFEMQVPGYIRTLKSIGSGKNRSRRGEDIHVHETFLEILRTIPTSGLGFEETLHMVNTGSAAAKKSQEVSPFNIKDDKRQQASLLTVKTVMLSLVKLLSVESDQNKDNILKLLSALENMLVIWNHNGWLDSRVGASLFQSCAVILGQLLAHMEKDLEGDALVLWTGQAFNSVEGILDIRNKKNNTSWVLGYLDELSMTVSLKQELAHFMLHNWLTIHYLLDDKSHSVLNDLLRVMKDLYGGQAWAEAMNVSVDEMVDNPLQMAPYRYLLRRNIVFLSRVLNRRLSQFSRNDSDALKQMITILPTGNPLSDLIYEKFHRVVVKLPLLEEGNPEKGADQKEVDQADRPKKKRTDDLARDGKRRSKRKVLSRSSSSGGAKPAQRAKTTVVASDARVMPSMAHSLSPMEQVQIHTHLLGEQAYQIYQESSVGRKLDAFMDRHNNDPLLCLDLADKIISSPEVVSNLRLLTRELRRNVILKNKSINHASNKLNLVLKHIEHGRHYLNKGHSGLQLSAQFDLQEYLELIHDQTSELQKKAEHVTQLLVEAETALTEQRTLLKQEFSRDESLERDTQYLKKCYRRVADCSLGLEAIRLKHSRRFAGSERIDELAQFMKKLSCADVEIGEGAWGMERQDVLAPVILESPLLHDFPRVQPWVRRQPIAEPSTFLQAVAVDQTYQGLLKQCERYQDNPVKDMDKYAELEWSIKYLADFTVNQMETLNNLIRTDDGADIFVFVQGGRNWYKKE